MDILQLLPKDVYDAATGANTPSATNVFATVNDVTAATNLQAVMDNGSTATGLFTDVTINTEGSVSLRSEIVGLDSYAELLLTEGFFAQLSFTDIANTSSFNIGTVSNTFTDGINLKGIEYAGNYEGNFTAKSLVTKQYVDAQVGASDTLQEVMDNGSTWTGSGAVTMQSDGLSGGFIFRDDDALFYSEILIETVLGVQLIHFDGTNTNKLVVDQTQNVFIDAINQVGIVYGGNYDTLGTLDDNWIPSYRAVKAYADSVAGTSTLQEVMDNGSTASLTDTDISMSVTDSGFSGANITLTSTNTTFGFTNEMILLPSAGSVELRSGDGVGNQSFEIYADGTDAVFTDSINSKGIVYADDYSANFTAHSLVDKAYVDGAVATAADGNGMFDVANQSTAWAVTAFTLGGATTVTMGANNLTFDATTGDFNVNAETYVNDILYVNSSGGLQPFKITTSLTGGSATVYDITTDSLGTPNVIQRQTPNGVWQVGSDLGVSGNSLLWDAQGLVINTDNQNILKFKIVHPTNGNVFTVNRGGNIFAGVSTNYFTWDTLNGISVKHSTNSGTAFRVLDTTSSEVLKITENGWLSVNLSAPSFPLHVNGNSQFENGDFTIKGASGTTDLLFADEDGDVIGFGTGTPDTNYKTHTVGDTRIDGATYHDATFGAKWYPYRTVPSFSIGVESGQMIYSSNGNHIFKSGGHSGTVQMWLNSTGLAVANSTSGTYKFYVNGGTGTAGTRIAGDVFLDGGAAGITSLAVVSSLNRVGINMIPSEVTDTLTMQGNVGENVRFRTYAATSGNIDRSSPSLLLTGTYWNGAASQDITADIQQIPVGTGGTANLTISNNSNIGIEVSETGGIKLPNAGTPTNGYVLTSDASGNATWQAASGGGGNSIYTTDDSLTGARTVSMGANNLTWETTTGQMIFGTHPTEAQLSGGAINLTRVVGVSSERYGKIEGFYGETVSPNVKTFELGYNDGTAPLGYQDTGALTLYKNFNSGTSERGGSITAHYSSSGGGTRCLTIDTALGIGGSSGSSHTFRVVSTGSIYIASFESGTGETTRFFNNGLVYLGGGSRLSIGTAGSASLFVNGTDSTVGEAFRTRNGDVVITTGGGITPQLEIIETTGLILMANLPTSAPATSGALWNNGGVINVVP